MDEQQNSSYPLSTSETETSAPLILSDPDNISTPARASRVTVCLQYSRTLTAESFTLKMTLSRHSRGGLRSSSTITLSVVVPLLIMPILIIVIIICWWMNYTKNKTDKRKIHVEIQHDTKLAGLRDEINRIDPGILQIPHDHSPGKKEDNLHPKSLKITVFMPSD